MRGLEGTDVEGKMGVNDDFEEKKRLVYKRWNNDLLLTNSNNG